MTSEHGIDRPVVDGDVDATTDQVTLVEPGLDPDELDVNDIDADSDSETVVVGHDDTVVDDDQRDHHDRDGDDQHDQDVDDELDRLDDGGSVIGAASAATSDARSEALPFVLTAREHFASVGEVEITGDARVDAATARLDEIPDLPTSDHVAVYDDVHRRLQDALSDAEVR